MLVSFCMGAVRSKKVKHFPWPIELVKIAKNLLSSFEKKNHMNWKQLLRELEKGKRWDEAIKFMQEVIQENPNAHEVLTKN